MKLQELNSGYCWCVEEQQLKPCNEFYRIKGKQEYQEICKSCVMRIKKRTQRSSEYQITKILLRKIGYNPEAEESIYEQFMKKHQL